MRETDITRIAAAARPRDVVVVVVLCVFVVLTAGAIGMGGRLRAKTLMCQKNLREIGKALVSYADTYDGALPTLELYGGAVPWIQHYYVVRRDFPNLWYHLGCLYAGGFIGDGRTLYCPAAGGSLDEYLSYANPAPWGSLPQNSNNPPTGNGNQWIRTFKGYAYWPQSKDIVKTSVATEVHPNAVGIYQVGYPKSASSLGKLDENKSVVSDIVFHKEGQFKVNALFWDGSVIYQDGPNQAGGNRLYFSTMQFDSPADYAAGWAQVTIAEWMWQLHR